MITVTLYYSSSGDDDAEIINTLEKLKPEVDHKVVKIDVNSDPALKAAFPLTPVLQVGPYRLEAPISPQEVQVALMAARDRKSQLQTAGDKVFQKRSERSEKLSSADRFGFWLSNHYMFLFNLVVLVYVGLPFLAPVLMKAGAEGAARVIYTMYSPLCHQLAFRSFFLFGAQPFYPRELANVPGMLSYEQVTNQGVIDLVSARRFIGNEVMGYKMALCERDMAIYGAILLFGLLFSLSGRKIKSLPWYLWIVLGLVPIGIDGFSQLPGLLQNHLPAWVVIRESTPLLRAITGAMFGLSTAWYVYPIVQETLLETRRTLIKKTAAINQGS